jgi:hypothetical protein
MRTGDPCRQAKTNSHADAHGRGITCRIKDLSASRVLIVDDDRSIRKALQNHMKDHPQPDDMAMLALRRVN